MPGCSLTWSVCLYFVLVPFLVSLAYSSCLYIGLAVLSTFLFSFGRELAQEERMSGARN